MPGCDLLGTQPYNLINNVVVCLLSETARVLLFYLLRHLTSRMQPAAVSQPLSQDSAVDRTSKLTYMEMHFLQQGSPISTWPHCLIMPLPMGQTFNHRILRGSYLFKPLHFTPWPHMLVAITQCKIHLVQLQKFL